MRPIAVIDFETTGMSPAQNARATEIGVAIIEQGQIVARYQSLMNSGAWVPPFIEQLTGISNAMLRDAPPAAQVMHEVADFVGDLPLLAHNAAFDQKFWDAELARVGRQRVQPFACSLLLSRRLLPMAPSHKLGVLNRWAQLPSTGKAHRALADAEMAANLTCFMAALLRERHGLAEVSHRLFCDLQKVPAAKIGQTLQRWRGA
ncbi:MAG: 3'-5' exonuclease [Gammaproteobacteria bacterium]|jgi:DNA polymerase-3 subunit epsilon|nr:3'-5' exonuclease [Gammaproteobacteria bacterium]MBU2066984.1 3'-5' exonuclease [Gammaproteobacteria bacterium]MBU2138977.1 3'-5' exonuclease [Gammaproteobacteria bacterium]MBU2216322.1 3'-5' exonuclease [Gammaproteobacteria bacterium]MBU2325309.1 3'-5' exonuclease [Gammaproteobacteria bacterium]